MGNRFFTPPGRRFLVVVSAAQIVTALGADQLAAVAGELVAAGGANAAVVVHTRSFKAGLDEASLFAWRLVCGVGCPRYHRGFEIGGICLFL